MKLILKNKIIIFIKLILLFNLKIILAKSKEEDSIQIESFENSSKEILLIKNKQISTQKKFNKNKNFKPGKFIKNNLNRFFKRKNKKLKKNKTKIFSKKNKNKINSYTINKFKKFNEDQKNKSLILKSNKNSFKKLKLFSNNKNFLTNKKKNIEKKIKFSKSFINIVDNYKLNNGK
jgi:hypothetical protein